MQTDETTSTTALVGQTTATEATGTTTEIGQTPNTEATLEPRVTSSTSRSSTSTTSTSRSSTSTSSSVSSQTSTSTTTSSMPPFEVQQQAICGNNVSGMDNGNKRLEGSLWKGQAVFDV
eukprot:3514638-Amphidinium_carterae.1